MLSASENHLMVPAAFDTSPLSVPYRTKPRYLLAKQRGTCTCSYAKPKRVLTWYHNSLRSLRNGFFFLKSFSISQRTHWWDCCFQLHLKLQSPYKGIWMTFSIPLSSIIPKGLLLNKGHFGRGSTDWVLLKQSMAKKEKKKKNPQPTMPAASISQNTFIPQCPSVKGNACFA